MLLPDLINGVFESLGGVSILAHCRKLYRDKQVRGVDWRATTFFTSWGYWNLYYYPHLGQWWSVAGGAVIVLANTLWVGMMIHYIRAERT